MALIEKQDALDAYCDRLKHAHTIFVDTEFLREKTYYPKLCLIQVASEETEAVAIDPLQDDLNLKEFWDILCNEAIVKVLHSGSQDLEIFLKEAGRVPHPLFDTQIAAAYLGYGEQAAYASLVKQILGEELDKGQQYTDWSVRPLSAQQLVYALNDVIYLAQIYPVLKQQLGDKKRESWVAPKFEELTEPSKYAPHPEEAWKKIRIRSDKPKHMVVLRELAAWRELRAQEKNLPKTYIMRDETLCELALNQPRSMDKLKRVRGLSDKQAEGKFGQSILDLIEKGLSLPKSEWPAKTIKKPFPKEKQAALEMMRMLLKIRAAEEGLAASLIATSDDLQDVVLQGEKADNKLISGWQYDVFGKDALALLQGKIGLSLKNDEIVRTDLNA